ncbi:MAG: alpha-L-fucosidase, partial [Pricia sp.]|nr:alpha-L-fucosidase [Pricia sp.]
VYAIAKQRPEAPFIIEGTKDWNDDTIKVVELVGSKAEVAWKITKDGLRITPPSDLGKSQFAWSFKIVTDRNQSQPNVVENNVNTVLEGTKEVDLEGF